MVNDDDYVEAEILGDDPGPIKQAMVESTGKVYNPADMKLREMPAKELGKHRFAAVATFYLAPGQAEAAHEAGNMVLLDPSNLLLYGIACVDCDTPYHMVRKTCPAKPSEWWS